MKPMTLIVALSGLLLSAASLPGQHHGGGTPQRIARASGQKIEIAHTIMVRRYDTKEVEVPLPGGKTEKRQVQEITAATDTIIDSHSAAELKPHTADRRPIAEQELLKRLEKETLVFVCEGNQKADAAYISLLKPETICLFLPFAGHVIAGHVIGPEEAPPAEKEPAPFVRSLPAASQPAAGLAIITTGGKCVVRQRNVYVFKHTAYRTIETPAGSKKEPYSIKTTSTADPGAPLARAAAGSEGREFAASVTMLNTTHKNSCHKEQL